MKMIKPKISILLPVYNSEKTLALCIKSILLQTYKNFELIIIDNNSKDNSQKIIKNFKKKDKRIIYLFEQKQGRATARNAGIKIAKGKIIAMTDSDCIVPKNWIQKLTKPIKKNKEQATLGHEQEAIKNFWTKNIQSANWNYLKSTIKGNYTNHIDTKNFAIVSTLLKNNLFDEKLKAAVDYELYLKLRNKTKIKFLPDVKVKHFHQSNFKEASRMNFERGYYAYLIFKKYENLDLKKEPMMKSMFLKNILKYPLRIIKELNKKPLTQTYFQLILAVSWILGGFLAKLSKNK